MAPSLLLHRLPREVRDKIYRYLLIDSEPITWDHCKTSRLDCHPRRLSSQILRTCRQIHDEGHVVLYGENTIKLAVYDGILPVQTQAPTAAWKTDRRLHVVKKFNLHIYADRNSDGDGLKALRGLASLPKLQYLKVNYELLPSFAQRRFWYVNVPTAPPLEPERYREEVLKIVRNVRVLEFDEVEFERLAEFGVDGLEHTGSVEKCLGNFMPLDHRPLELQEALVSFPETLGWRHVSKGKKQC